MEKSTFSEENNGQCMTIAKKGERILCTFSTWVQNLSEDFYTFYTNLAIKKLYTYKMSIVNSKVSFP